jgi:hypothetical protein
MDRKALYSVGTAVGTYVSLVAPVGLLVLLAPPVAAVVAMVMFAFMATLIATMAGRLAHVYLVRADLAAALLRDLQRGDVGRPVPREQEVSR